MKACESEVVSTLILSGSLKLENKGALPHFLVKEREGETEKKMLSS